jgi:hypothetical protein
MPTLLAASLGRQQNHIRKGRATGKLQLLSTSKNLHGPPPMQNSKIRPYSRLRKFLRFCNEYRKERVDARRRQSPWWEATEDYEGYVPLTRSNLFSGTTG